MASTLSEKLNMRVNEYPIVLNEKINIERLDNHDIKKAGFLTRLMIKPQKGEVVFWSKNCLLKYIDDDYKNTILPILDNKRGAHLMFGTTAYLFFEHNMLSKFIFQIIRNAYAARLNLEEFEEALVNSIGEASTSDQTSKTWKEGNQSLILEFPDTRQHGYIHLILNNG